MDDMLDIDFTDGQLDKLADIYVGLSNVSFGMSVIPGILRPQDTPVIVLVVGLTLGLVFSVISLAIARKL